MILLQGHPIRQSAPQPFPKDILLLGEFKTLVNRLVESLGMSKRFKPRLYTYADFVITKFYALICGESTEKAANRLNRQIQQYYADRFRLNLKLFQDGKRKRRLIPHQTDVDKFFRLFTEKEVNTLFGNLIMALNKEIFKSQIGSSKFRFLVDNTEYGYYGIPNPMYDIGTNRKPGTKVCHMFQGHVLQGSGMTLFLDFFLLKKGQYRGISIPPSVEWAKWNGIHLSYALMDREFYRAALIKDLKNRKLGVIIPAKKYLRVRNEIRKYLFGQRKLVEPYHFCQTATNHRWIKTVHVNLVIVGKRNRSAAQIREQYRQKILDYDSALHELAAFFTTLPPRKNLNRWARWLTKAYKKRWCQETGFSKLNEVHISFRNRHPTVQLAQLYLRGIYYNNWQYYKRCAEHLYIRPSHRSMNIYKDYFKTKLELYIKSNISQNIKYAQIASRKKYFGP